MTTEAETAVRNVSRAAALIAMRSHVVSMAVAADDLARTSAEAGTSLRAASDSWSLVIDAVHGLPEAHLSTGIIYAATNAHASCRYDDASDALATSRTALARIRAALV